MACDLLILEQSVLWGCLSSKYAKPAAAVFYPMISPFFWAAALTEVYFQIYVINLVNFQG